MRNNNGYITFNDILIDLSFRLGRDNLHNEQTMIKRYIIDAEHEINPYSSLLVKKKVTYHKGNGNFDGKNIVRPKDFFEIDDSIGDLSCMKYVLNPSFIILCNEKKLDKVTFAYYGYACDGTGNPFTTINHKEAILAYLEFMYYKPKMHQGRGNMNMYLQLERNWFDRCMESRGEDAMNEIARNYNSLSYFNTTTTRGLYLEDLCQSSSPCFEIETNDSNFMNKKVFFWQFNNIANTSRVDETTNDLFLQNKPSFDLSNLINGQVINFTDIGKYGFCIEDVNSENDIDIFDLTGSSLDNSMSKYYDPKTRRLSFLSNSLITHSSIFFKFKYNG